MDKILATYNAEKLVRDTNIPHIILWTGKHYIVAEESDFIRHPELRQCKVYKTIKSERDTNPSMF